MLIAPSCSDNEEDNHIYVTSVKISKPQLFLTVDQNETLTATVIPESATEKTVTWSSDDPEVASVDQSTGKVTALSIGEAVITVTTKDGNYKDHCTVTVAEAIIAVTGVKIDNEDITLHVGEMEVMTATITPEDATDKSVT
ncbi:MAG: Ig-like domain-containing protein [Tannerellaceae bacterium]|nr:Ig-like domain-containing protein [Tannerellaceae bacterium]